jgi:ABC-type dipeptide/oligopeptide/nickel transport system permease component
VKRWWAQPLVRAVVALALPFAVPAIITLLIWALPGSPADNICRGATGCDALAARWNLDQGMVHFYLAWMGDALRGDLGRSWSAVQGVGIRELLAPAVPVTVMLISLSVLPLFLGAALAGLGWIPRRFDPIFQAVGLVPAMVPALVVYAVITLAMGAVAADGSESLLLKLFAGALILGTTDGALSGAITGTRSVFDNERKQQYVLVAQLRGEGVLSNTLPNVAGALAGQLRARILHLLSGAVIVEAVLRIDGLGDFLWRATLHQDFGLLLAAATGFALVSGVILLLQASLEVLVAWHQRRAPQVPVAVGA